MTIKATHPWETTDNSHPSNQINYYGLTEI